MFSVVLKGLVELQLQNLSPSRHAEMHAWLDSIKNLYGGVRSDLRFPLKGIALIIHNNIALIINQSNQ